MTTPILAISGISKVFQTFRHEIFRVLRWFHISAPIESEKWVLRDISFQVPAGQALAIVGRNGAGKSTLLKLIVGTMRPSTGAVEIKGHIAAILELGMGFNPDFTGRQNVFHSLGLMGRQHADILAVIDQIEEFSELGDYFDQPLRVYSSGMHMRLAFSVATAFRPDILIVDEALSVGDSYFQHKSFDKIKEFRALGTTLILVSHDRMALLSLCDRAILLNEGQIALDGDPESVLDYYNALLGQQGEEGITTETLEDGRIRTSSGSGKATIKAISLQALDGKVIDQVDVGERVVLCVEAQAHENIEKLVLGYAIKDRFGQTINGTNTFYTDQVVENIKQGQIFRFRVKLDINLGEGTYSFAVALASGENHIIGENYEWRDLAIMFDVTNLSKHVFDGRVYLPADIQIEAITE
ncbi:MAG: ABC transporter ATP-binding protein [Cohaesibacter sp.]|nr:ABC transporter ATP-binding protein [Cohaesibacter sp.]